MVSVKSLEPRQYSLIQKVRMNRRLAQLALLIVCFSSPLLAINRPTADLLSKLIDNEERLLENSNDATRLESFIANIFLSNLCKKIKSVVKIGADPNIETMKKKFRAIHVAALSGDLRLLKRLALRGANLHTKIDDERGRTALHMALERGNAQVIEYLLRDAFYYPTLYQLDGDNRYTLIHAAAMSGEVELCELILGVSSVFLITPTQIHDAAVTAWFHGNHDIHNFLIDYLKANELLPELSRAFDSDSEREDKATASPRILYRQNGDFVQLHFTELRDS